MRNKIKVHYTNNFTNKRSKTKCGLLSYYHWGSSHWNNITCSKCYTKRPQSLKDEDMKWTKKQIKKLEKELKELKEFYEKTY